MTYLDTSWLVKLYVDEADSTAVRSLVATEDVVVVSELAHVEFHAAVARRRREGTLSSRLASDLLERFRREWPQRTRVAVSPEVLLRAIALVDVHPLRSLDAMHLASALLFARETSHALRFGAGDARLTAAARAEGLAVMAPA